MATLLDKKAVVREVRDWRRKGFFGLGSGGGASRNLVITLVPGNIISFREKGLRTRYDIDIESVYNMAVHRTIAKQREEAKKAKKAKRAGLA